MYDDGCGIEFDWVVINGFFCIDDIVVGWDIDEGMNVEVMFVWVGEISFYLVYVIDEFCIVCGLC